MNKRLTFDDLQKSGSSVDIKQDSKGRPRIIKKKAEPLPEMYANETQLKKAAEDLLLKLDRVAMLNSDKTGPEYFCANGRVVATLAKMPGEWLNKEQENIRMLVLDSGGIFIIYQSIHQLVQELKKHRLISLRFEL